MKLLGSIKNRITMDEYDENVPHLQITEVEIVYCNIVNKIISKIQGSDMNLFLINHLVIY